MEIIRGKHTSFICASDFADQTAHYRAIHIDLGTGDGRYVRQMAQANPDILVIGIDACRENLHKTTRRAPANALFIIANAYDLPAELGGLARGITINFPWGSLLAGLIRGENRLLDQLVNLAQAGCHLDLYLNGGALAEAGCDFMEGVDLVKLGLSRAGFLMGSPIQLIPQDIRAYPTSWAKRIAYGRDPRAVHLHGTIHVR